MPQPSPDKLSARMRNGRKPKRGAGGADLHSGPSHVDLQASGLEWLEAAADSQGDEGAQELKRFTMKAYTGTAMRIPGWCFPVVVKLAGLKVPPGSMAVLKNHDPDQIVGHADNIVKAESLLTVEGVISGAGEAAREVIDTAKNKFPWNVSVGAYLDDMIFIPEGATVQANGKEFKGPVYLARKATLAEVSFVPVGGDLRTSVSIAATGATNEEQTMTITFQKWLEAKGFDENDINDEQRTFLEAAWKAETTGDEGGSAGDRGTAHSPPAAPEAQGIEVTTEQAKQLYAAAIKSERQRVTDIQAACKDFTGDEVADLQAKAISGEMDLVQLQAKLLGVVRDGRPTDLRSTGGAGAPKADRQVLLAIAYRAGDVPEPQILEACGEPAMEAAYKLRGMGIQEYFARCAMLEGVELPRYTSEPTDWIRAAFSTMSLPGILGNTTSRALLEGYNYVEDAWRQVVKIASVSDFKQHTRYRLTGNMKFLKVGKDGELKHGTLGEQEFTQQADTEGIMFVLTRQDIINDDMGAFMAIPRLIGMGAGEAIAEAVWTLLLSNPSSFFHADNSNYETGSGTALAIDSLTAAELLFLTQTKPNGRPLGIAPKKLLVPSALKVTAEQLMASLKLTEGGGSSKSKVPTNNPHAGKFEPVSSAYLSNSAITGNSALAWYLFADPNVVAALEVAFLNGVDRPVVEKAEANFNVLGVQFRGWVDFGVKEQDYRGAVKMKGEA